MTSLDPVMPAGNTVYVTANLEEGRYAWLLGVPPEQGEIETRLPSNDPGGDCQRAWRGR